MAKYITGEKNGTIYWHEVDPAGPDPERVAEAQLGASFHKTLCGIHYGEDAVNSVPALTSFGTCPDC